jgi:pimeloyl-ACP methyl ester carboxylesterase
MRKETRLALIGAILVFVAGCVAWMVQTDSGKVAVRDLRFAGSNGTVMSALLFIPANATAKTPAPAILAVHGYINSRETQSGFAIEYARRGYVVLELDQTGHGYSDPPAFANGYGGPDGLAYLRSLNFVDKDNIGLEGHSMGGWTIGMAAVTNPTGYKSMVLEGSSTGSGLSPEGSTTYPRNLALVFSTHDEFAPLMWEVAKGSDAPKSGKLQKVFGTTETIQVGKVYGSIADGTARVLYQPNTTHPGDHLSQAAIGYSIDWFGQTLQGGKPLASTNQVWYWKELMTTLGFIGFVLIVLGAGGSLLGTKTFGSLAKPLPASKSVKGWGLWLGAVIGAALPVLLFFTFFKWGASLLKPSSFWPQGITNQIMFWAVANGIISLVLFLAWHFASAKKQGATAASYGLDLRFGEVLKTLGFAFLALGAGALALVASDYLFKIDFRFWVLALKPLSALQFRVALCYAVPFTAFFFVASLVWNGELRAVAAKPVGRYLFTMLTAAGGFLVFLLLQYIPLIAGGTLMTPTEPLNVIVAIQFLPLLIVAALNSTWFYEKTGRIWAGAFVNGLFVTWYIVAGQAFQFAVH